MEQKSEETKKQFLVLESVPLTLAILVSLNLCQITL